MTTRAFTLLPPAERPVKKRRAARLIVRCQGRALLELDTDPGLPGTSWWVTPGGGLDEGETYEQAAVRELAEETGWRITEADLVGPVAHRLVTHGYSDEILIQDELFFAVDVGTPFTPDTAGFTDEEQVTMAGFAWLSPDELRDDPRGALSISADDLAGLLDAGPGFFLEWGEVETSTVPA